MTDDRRAGSVAEHPSHARMLLRGATRRCAACGSGNVFTGWFRMRDRCPRCGYVFAREDGFSLGAILMNFAITEFLLVSCNPDWPRNLVGSGTFSAEARSVG